MVALHAYVADNLSLLSLEHQALYRAAWQEVQSATAAYVEGQVSARLAAAGAGFHQLCLTLQSALAAADDSASEHDTSDPAVHTAAGLLDSSDDSGEEGDAEAATQQRPKDPEEPNFITALVTVNVDGLQLELSEVAIQTALEAQKSSMPGAGVEKKAGN